MILNNTRKLSLVITNYNRCDLTLKCFEDVLDDSWVDEIVIVDDHSEIEIYNKLAEAVKGMAKVKLYRNEDNLDCYANKAMAICKATNEWCILFDSDNIIRKDYISAIYGQSWNNDTILAPVFAQYTFDYRQFEGHYILKDNVASYMGVGLFDTALNGMDL